MNYARFQRPRFALAALVVAAVLVRQVLAASEGTANMKEIAAAVRSLERTRDVYGWDPV